jgi:hypothetical protein
LRHLLQRLLGRCSRVDAYRLMAEDGEEHDAENVVAFDDEHPGFVTH